MKCKITCSGMLVIEPETELEAYAAAHWLEENLNDIADERTWPSVAITYRPEDLID